MRSSITEARQEHLPDLDKGLLSGFLIVYVGYALVLMRFRLGGSTPSPKTLIIRYFTMVPQPLVDWVAEKGN